MRSLPSSSDSKPATERRTGQAGLLHPIVEMRAVNYSWAEADPNDPRRALAVKKFRVEVRREGETEWTEIPVIERQGKPPG